MKFKYSAATDIGGRENNQDVFFAFDTVSDPENDVLQTCSGEIEIGENQVVGFSVCDGVGSYEGSGPAAKAVQSAIKEHFTKDTPETDAEAHLEAYAEETVGIAEKAIIDYFDAGNEYGAATLSLLTLADKKFCFVNMGDSPAYIFDLDCIDCRLSIMKELSERQTLAYYKKLMGMTACESDEHVILNCLGTSKKYMEDFYCSGSVDGSCAFLICSDGVTNEIPEVELEQMLLSGATAKDIVLRASNEYSDNCTCIVIRCEPSEETKAEDTTEDTSVEDISEESTVGDIAEETTVEDTSEEATVEDTTEATTEETTAEDTVEETTAEATTVVSDG